jgi:hypothetical protein
VSLLCPTPDGACGSCACSDRHVEVIEAEFAIGGGEEAEGVEHDATSRAKVSPSLSAEDWAIEVGDVAWHANGPLPGALTDLVLETRGQRDLCFVGDASVDSL